MAWKLFERMVQNTHLLQGFDDGLDSELDTIGVKLETGVVCGHCGISMETQDFRIFRCPLCDREFIQENS